MIYKETMVNVIDNSGALRCKVIHVYGAAPAVLGDLVLVTVRRYVPRRKVTIGSLHLAVVVRTKVKAHRNIGVSSIFDQNTVVLMKKVRNLTVVLGTRVRSTVSFDLRKKGFLKIVTLAPVLV